MPWGFPSFRYDPTEDNANYPYRNIPSKPKAKPTSEEPPPQYRQSTSSGRSLPQYQPADPSKISFRDEKDKKPQKCITDFASVRANVLTR